MLNHLRYKFELEDTIVQLHDRARELEADSKEVDIAFKIRQVADDLSEKLKKAPY